MKPLLLALSLVALASCTPAPASQDPAPAPAAAEPAGAAEKVELAEVMDALAGRMANIWFAGTAGNAPLLKYEIHELEEAVEDVSRVRPTEHGVPVADRLEAALAMLPALTEAAGDEAAFAPAYDAVVDACNTCHVDTEHGYIKVIRPTAPAQSNRSFE